jgi:hypothetical protein
VWVWAETYGLVKNPQTNYEDLVLFVKVDRGSEVQVFTTKPYLNLVFWASAATLSCP